MSENNAVFSSALDTVGNTPLVKIKASPAEASVYAKLETFNPGGSVKDRIGKYMLEKRLERGEIKSGGAVIEPTAGNTRSAFFWLRV